MVAKDKEGERLINEFDEWVKALKLLDYLLKLEVEDLICESSQKLTIEKSYIKEKDGFPILESEMVIHTNMNKETLKLLFIPIDISIYNHKNIYPVFSDDELENFEKFLTKLEKHIKVAIQIYEMLEDERKYVAIFLVNISMKDSKYGPFMSIRNCIPLNSKIIRQYIKNPPFMHMLSPIFKGELIFDEYINKFGHKVLVSNLINWKDSWTYNISRQIRNLLCFIIDDLSINELEKINNLKKKYYDSFLKPYFDIIKKFKNSKLSLKSIMDIFDTIYRQEPKKKRHRTPVDALRTPVPFCFWDFVRKRKYVKNNLRQNSNLKILWVDNNTSDAEKNRLKNILEYLIDANDKKINIEVSGVEPKEIKRIPENYKPHIIFLDFFLDNDDVEVASSFIEEFFGKVEDKGINHWIMITSRYTPVVVKYLESGFLGGYYPNAFVYLGDFWACTHGNNFDFNIIFGYKFIDLLESKIKFIRDIEAQIKEYIDQYLNNTDETGKVNIIEKNLLIKLKSLLIEIENIKDIIDLEYDKNLYNLVYSYIIYKNLLPDTEKDLIEELKRRIIYKLNTRGIR